MPPAAPRLKRPARAQQSASQLLTRSVARPHPLKHQPGPDAYSEINGYPKAHRWRLTSCGLPIMAAAEPVPICEMKVKHEHAIQKT